MTKQAKGYEDGFDYGCQSARAMSPQRRIDNARMVRESEYFQPHSVTREYWRGFVNAMTTTIDDFNRPN